MIENTLNFVLQGCHQLIRAGADGVIQAMVLSFAGKYFEQNNSLEKLYWEIYMDNF